jgi:gluconolactonase
MEPTSRPIEMTTVAEGLHFPEGPIAMPDGSVVLVEIPLGRISRVDPTSGKVEGVVDCGGGPNGLALGPDGKVYVCNNGGYFEWTENEGMTLPGATPPSHTGGSIQRVDLDTGEVETLYTECDGRGLIAPNDIVFDDQGGFWFTDHGVRKEEHPDRAGVLYAKADGSSISGAITGVDATNGVGLAPDGSHVYVSETHTGQLWSWALAGAGTLADPAASGDRTGGTLLYDAPDGHLFDSLAVDGDGWVCVGTLGVGGISGVAPDGSTVEHVPTTDALATNICFGGPGHGSDDYRTTYVTGSLLGSLFRLEWPRPGLQLPY